MKMRLVSLLVALLLLAGGPGVTAQPATVTLTASTTTCTGTTTACAFFGAQKQAGIGLQITGTFSGTVQFEQTIDGATWVSLAMTPYNSTSTVTSATAPGLWTAPVTNNVIRVRCSTYASGSIVVTMISTVGFKGGSGSGGGGGAPVDATYITQTPNGTLTNEQALSALATGLLSSTTVTGVVSAVTTSAGVAGLLSDETGSGALVFGTSPTIVTPTVASFTNATHTHQNAAGGGTLAEAALALTDVTTNNASSTAHGFLPKLQGMTLNAGTVATSIPTVFQQTWDDGGSGAVQFEEVVVNATNTSSYVGSRPLVLKIDNSEIFSVDRSGKMQTQGGGYFGQNLIMGSTAQVAAGAYISFSDGADFNAAIARVTGGSGGLKTSDSGSGYQEHQAQDFRLLPNGASRPTCDAAHRGTIWYEAAADGVPDTISACAKSTVDAYAWYALATIP